MFYLPDFKSALLLFLFFGTSVITYAEANRISLKQAMAQKAVTVEAVSNGGYCSKSITLELSNNTDSELVVDVDPALIFRSDDDTGAQSLVLLGNETVVLTPCKRASISLQTFCGKSYGHCPRVNSCYTYWKQGDSDMIKTLCYVKYNSIDIPLAQRAVWMFTNGYCLNSIYVSANEGMSKKFVHYLATLRNYRMPDYFMEYQIDTALRNHTTYAKDAKVYVTMHWRHEGYYRHMYLVIYKQNGELYKKIEADQVIDKDGITVKVIFDPKRDLKGAYTVQIHDDAHHVWDQKRVLVGFSACDMI